MVHRNGLRLLRLVNTLLDFSRIEAGRVQARFQPTELGAYTEELASNFRSACDRAGLRLETDACRWTGRSMSMPRCGSASSSTWCRMRSNTPWPAGSPSGCRRAADGQAAVLTVRDTGIGIPEAELPHIFDRFHRIEGQRGRTLEGTGIGLALVNELVRLHGGSIAVESQVDVGTTVSVRIPFGVGASAGRSGDETAGRGTPEGIAAAAFVEEALRWLPRGRRGSDGGRCWKHPACWRRWARTQCRRRARSGGGSCLPTTMPTCATMSCGCCGRDTRSRRWATGRRRCWPRGQIRRT